MKITGWTCVVVLGCHEVAGVEDKRLVLDAAAPSREGGGGAEDGSPAPPDPPGDARTRPIDVAAPGRPPPPPDGDPVPGGGDTLAFAARAMHMGTADPETDEPDPEYWRKLGFDLDGRQSTLLDLTNGAARTCASDALPEALQDGEDGRDNSVGKNVVSFLASADPYAERKTNEGLARGRSTLVFVLDDVGSGPDDPYVPGALYLSANEENVMEPRWDGTDRRRLWKGSLIEGTQEAIARFPYGYLRDNVWVSGDEHSGDVLTWLPIYPADRPLLTRLRSRAGFVTIALDAERLTASSMMASVLTKDDLRTLILPFIESALLCNVEPAAEMIDSLAGNVDVVTAAPFDPDPSQPCDGLSLGIGASLVRIASPAPEDFVDMDFQVLCPTDAGL